MKTRKFRRKNKTIQIRINAKTKAKLEKIFKRLKIKMSEAINTYFEKVLIWDNIQLKTIRKKKRKQYLLKSSKPLNKWIKLYGNKLPH